MLKSLPTAAAAARGPHRMFIRFDAWCTKPDLTTTVQNYREQQNQNRRSYAEDLRARREINSLSRSNGCTTI